MTQRFAYSVREVVEMTSLSRSTIYNLAKAGRLRLCRIGGRSVVLHDDLVALFAT